MPRSRGDRQGRVPRSPLRVESSVLGLCQASGGFLSRFTARKAAPGPADLRLAAVLSAVACARLFGAAPEQPHDPAPVNLASQGDGFQESNAIGVQWEN